MTVVMVGPNRKSLNLAAANAWVRLGGNKEAAGQTSDAIGAYKCAMRIYEKLGEDSRVTLITARIKKLQDAIDSTNATKTNPVNLPKRTLTTPRRGRGRPNGATGGAHTRGTIFDFIVAYKRKHDGNSPTSREIMDAAKLSSISVVHFHLHKMVLDGRITLPPQSSARSIMVRGGQWTFIKPDAGAGDEAE